MTCGIYYFWDDLKDNLVYIGKSINIEEIIKDHLKLSSIDIKKLEKKVRNKNLPWEVL